jgi:4-amino-4-deoxy-L-arabinose transferase-like glycosyltransferase
MILSLTPWHYFYSRAAFEVTLLTTLILAATYFFYTYVQKDKIFFLYLSVILFGLSFYTYNTANIFTPLLVLYLLFTNNFLKKQLNLKNLFLIITLTLVLISPMVKEILWGKATERFSSLNIFSNQTIVDQIITKRTSFSSLSNQTIERIFHNKLINFSTTFLKNYFQSISPSFLFFNENQLNPRHSISSNGLLFITFFILLVHGLFNLDKTNKYHHLFVYWLIISPIPAAMTINGGTHPTRLFLMIVPLSFFIALSISKILKSKYSLLIVSIIIVALASEIAIFSHEYFVHYPKDNPTIWNHGYKQLFTDLSKLNYNRLFISNSKYNSLLPYLFYNQIVPTTIDLDDHEKQNIIEKMPGFKISDSIFFINDWKHNNEIYQKIDSISSQNDVFILFQFNEIPGDMDLSKDSLINYKTIKTIYNPDKSILGQVIQRI